MGPYHSYRALPAAVQQPQQLPYDNLNDLRKKIGEIYVELKYNLLNSLESVH